MCKLNKLKVLAPLALGGAALALAAPASAGSYCGTGSCGKTVMAAPVVQTVAHHRMVVAPAVSHCGSACAPVVRVAPLHGCYAYSSCGVAPLVIRPAVHVTPVVRHYVPVMRPVHYTYPVARVGCGVRYAAGHC